MRPATFYRVNRHAMESLAADIRSQMLTIGCDMNLPADWFAFMGRLRKTNPDLWQEILDLSAIEAVVLHEELFPAPTPAYYEAMDRRRRRAQVRNAIGDVALLAFGITVLYFFYLTILGA